MLTNERLKKLSEMRITELIDNITFGDLKEIVEELLAIREAGDEEVNWCREELAKTDEELRLIKDLNENHDIAIARGQQLREAREEIERLKRENDTIKGYFPSGAFEAKPQHEEWDGGCYDLFPGGLYQ